MNGFLDWFIKNKPVILTGLGLGCMVAATISAIDVAPDAKKAEEELKEELNVEKLPVKEWVVNISPYFATPLLFTCVGAACICGGNHIYAHREAAAMAAYTITDATLRETREKTRELLGKKKEKDINEAVAKDIVQSNPINGREIIITGKGDTLCLEKISGRYFRSDIEQLKRIQNNLNRRMMDTTFISVNELFYEIGIGPITLGDELGWDIDRGLIEMRFSAQLTEDGDPCLVLDFDVGPRHY